MKRGLSWIVLVLCVIGAIYYALAYRETRGDVILLLGILFFVALPHLTSSNS